MKRELKEIEIEETEGGEKKRKRREIVQVGDNQTRRKGSRPRATGFAFSLIFAWIDGLTRLKCGNLILVSHR
jgi:hypothetical protein